MAILPEIFSANFNSQHTVNYTPVFAGKASPEFFACSGLNFSFPAE